MNGKEAAQSIRSELKKHGYTSRDVSVKSHWTGVSIEVKTPSVSYRQVIDIVNAYDIFTYVRFADSMDREIGILAAKIIAGIDASGAYRVGSFQVTKTASTARPLQLIDVDGPFGTVIDAHHPRDVAASIMKRM